MEGFGVDFVFLSFEFTAFLESVTHSVVGEGIRSVPLLRAMCCE